MNTYKTPSEAYTEVLKDVWTRNEHRSAPRGLVIREKLDYMFHVDSPTNDVPIVTGLHERDAVVRKYYYNEMHLYHRGTLAVSEWTKISKFWETIKNPDETINSNYGYLIFNNPSCGDPKYEDRELRVMRTPWEWALMSLLEDTDTRQAYVRVALPRHQWIGNKDQVCTMHLHFRIIHQDTLCLTVVMRSNDVMKGLVYDMPYFNSLLYKMQYDLKRGVTIGSHLKNLNVNIGWYRHFTHSMHIYESDQLMVRKILGHTFIEEKTRGHD